MAQLPDEYRVDFENHGQDRPDKVIFGVTISVEKIEHYSIKKGWYDPDSNYESEEQRIDAAVYGAEQVRRHLERVVGQDSRYPSVRFEYAELEEPPEGSDGPWGFMIGFYSNHTPIDSRLDDVDEKFAIDFLREELDLTPEEAKPMWYFQFDDWS
jgi:hypothetical protein